MKALFRLTLIALILKMYNVPTVAYTHDHFLLDFLTDPISKSDSVPPNPLEKFKGEWRLKDNIFESQTDGKYIADVNPNRSFIARDVNTNSSILWSEDFDGLKVDIFWTYDLETKNVYHLSNTSSNGLAHGMGPLQENGNLNITLTYPDACDTCTRIYSFRWKSENEFIFRATFYQDDKATGDYYGATFIRKK